MVVLSAAFLKTIEAAAAAAYPKECCGLLAGRTGADGATQITRIVPSRNLAASARADRFEVDPQVRFDLMRTLDGTDEDMVGHYHSHPDHPALPSEHDMAVAWEPDLIWLITTVKNGLAQETTAHRLNRETDTAQPLTLVIKD